MGVCHSASGNAFETCAGAVVGREWPSCGEGVVRASAFSELTERVKFFFCAITILEHPIISVKLKTFFVIDRVARKSCDGRRYLRSMYSLISVREVRLVAPLADAPYRHLRRLEQRRGPEERCAE